MQIKSGISISMSRMRIEQASIIANKAFTKIIRQTMSLISSRNQFYFTYII